MHYPEKNYAYHLRWLRTTGWALWWIWDGFEKAIWEEYGENSQYPLMQYTGLKDRQGKEIYEGDVVQYQNNEPESYLGTIVFNSEVAAFVVNEAVGGWDSIELAQTGIVIGNIYENLELLTP